MDQEVRTDQEVRMDQEALAEVMEAVQTIHGKGSLGILDQLVQ